MKETREAIFKAASEQLADHGLAEFHIPRLAEAAGVSVRTVYRYFPTKEDLLEAFAHWLDDQIGTLNVPTNLEELVDGVEEIFAAFDENEDVIRSQWATPHGRAIREKGRLGRLATIRASVEKAVPHLQAAERRRATAMLSLLHSSRTWQTLSDDFGMSGREAGKLVAWALRTLADDLRRRDDEAARRHGKDLND
jgi:AcrR family transcriptional regulator